MRTILKCGFLTLSMMLIIGLIVPVGALAEKTIKIGVIYPLTGGAAAAGRDERREGCHRPPPRARGRAVRCTRRPGGLRGRPRLDCRLAASFAPVRNWPLKLPTMP